MINTTLTYANKVRDMYHKVTETAFIPNVIFTQLVGDKVWQSGVDGDPGEAVDIYTESLLPPQTGDLDETNDPDSLDLDDTITKVTLREKGGLVQTTKKLDYTTFNKTTASVNKLVGINAAESTDIYIREQLDAQLGSDYVFTSNGGALNTISNSDGISGELMRKGLAFLRRENVDPRFGDGAFIAMMHPDQYNDLTGDVGTGGVLDVGRYSTPNDLFLRNEVGKYANFRIVTSTNCKVDYTGGLPVLDTTLSGNALAGDVTIPLTSTVGLTLGDKIAIEDNNGDFYTYPITAISAGVSVDIGKAINKNGNVTRRKTVGLVVDANSGLQAIVANPVYTTYLAGMQALAYAWAKKPTVESFIPQTGMRRKTNVYWYAIHGAEAFRDEALIKIFSGATINNP